MDGSGSSGHYQPPSSRQHHLFQSPQLPPPSQLHLPPTTNSGFSRSNTLPPIANIPSSNNNHQHRSSYPYPSNNQLPPLATPSGSSWGHHRTSSSRDELHPSQHHSQQQQQQHHGAAPPYHRSDSSRKDPAIKRETVTTPMHHHDHGGHSQGQSSGQQQQVKEQEDGMPATSDFVKKLFKMLEDPTFSHTVCWAPGGDSFVVKDMNEFTKSILPRMFKHSNFASFVRQLNKYDFHKVKNTDDNQFGEHSWTFRHPDFHAERRDALENIKRKVPTQRKSLTSSTPTSTGPSIPQLHTQSSSSPSPTYTAQLQSQVDRLTRSQEEMTTHIHNLEKNYQDVLKEMVNFQKNMAQQDGLMQNLIQYFLQVENGKVKQENAMPTMPVAGNAASNTQAVASTSAVDPSSSTNISGVKSNTIPMSSGPLTNPFLPTEEAQRMMGGSYPETDVARASLVQMNEISRRAEVAGMSFAPATANGDGASNDADARGEGVERPNSALKMMANAAGLMLPEVDTKASIIGSPNVGPTASGSGGTTPIITSRQDALARIGELHRSRPASASGIRDATFGVNGTYDLPFDGQGWADGATAGGPGPSGGPAGALGSSQDAGHEGLRVFTMGHLMPKSAQDDGNGNWSFDPGSLNTMVPALTGGEVTYNAAASSSGSGSRSGPGAGPGSEAGPSAGPGTSVTARPSTAQKLRVRRSTFVPGWAVPPRVLLVDDDEVNRRMSSKFLQVFGCTIDVAVDGVGAVERMNLEKYDLVLMDIVMPKLDGISATSMIRQFDHMTPIISMTSNSKPNEIMTYYSSGMNDILPKPFTQDGLLDMLEKHLMHLKVIQQMAQIPRSVGIPPLSDSAFEQALAVGASNNSLMAAGGSDEADGRINPLAGMGLTDEQYTTILQNLVNSESFSTVQLPADGLAAGPLTNGKRGLEDDDDDDGRDGKRGRFEVLE